MPTDLLDLPGWCSGCWPHDGEVAGGADSILAIFRFRGDAGARAIGATDDDDVGFAGSGWWRRRGATYGVDRSTMANSQALRL